MRVIFLLIAVVAAVTVNRGEACEGKLQVIFLVDGSSSVCDDEIEDGTCSNWQKLLNFINQIIDTLDIGNTKVALASYGATVDVKIFFDNGLTKEALKAAVSALVIPGGELTDVEQFQNVGEILDPERGFVKADKTKLVLPTNNAGVSKADAASKSCALQQAVDGAMLIACVEPSLCTVDVAKAVSSPPHTAGETYFMIDSYSVIDNGQWASDVAAQLCVKNEGKVCTDEVPT